MPAALLVLLMTLVGPAPAAAAPFGLETVAGRAEALAGTAFEDPRGRVPQWLLDVSYDRWRDIRFRPEAALWRGTGLPFTAQFFHPGLFYDRPVAINEVDAQGVHPVPFSPSNFDYGRNDFASRVPQDLGYAGFRLHYPIRTPTYQDEVIVFLGASYFRAVGADDQFGLSARGLAVDTAEPTGEEFPWFREFWIVRPAPGAHELIVYALLDSPRVTGAYRFVVTPGRETLVAVRARLFLRDAVTKLGIAPLTSMFLHGETSPPRTLDFRPEVHDSDGLLMASATGEWLWRPLVNPERISVNAFTFINPRGFGLLQRDRNFDHYQDLEARPDRRPSVWVAPDGEWGEGRVELVELPTDDDTNDNVVAYWVPRAPAAPGHPLEFAYRLTWGGSGVDQSPAGRVLATRRDRPRAEGVQRLLVDFGGAALERLPASTVVEGVVTIGAGDGEAGTLHAVRVQKIPVTGAWRLVLDVEPATDDPIELRAFLRRGTEVLTETWSALLTP